MIALLGLVFGGCSRWSIADRIDPPPPAKKVEGVRCVGINPPPSYEYRIGVGDTLSLRFFFYMDMSETAIQVPSTGMVQMPLLGPVPVLGYTEDELNEVLREKYSGRLMFPDLVARVTLRVHDGVYLDGVGATVGRIPYNNHLTLLDTLQKAGMGGNSGALHSIIVIRGLNSPQYTSFRVNAKEILKGKQHDIYLEPNDIVFIPKKFIFDVNYFVEHYIDGVLGNHIMPAQIFPQPFPYKADIQHDIGIDILDIP